MVLVHRNKFCRILDPQNIEHLSMQEGKIVKLRCTLGQLKNCLVLDNLLRHRSRIGIADRDNIHIVVVRLFRTAAAFSRFIVILLWCVLSNNTFQQIQLLFKREVDTGLYSRHHLKGALHNRQCCTNRSLARHITNLHISSISKTTTFFYDLV